MPPIAGEAINPETYRQIGNSGVDAIVCDSTNATQPGSSYSEYELFSGLLEAVKHSKGRVVVGCFSSNVARMQTLGNVARVAGRYLGLLGRSMEAMVQSAKMAGYLSENFEVVDGFNLGYLLPQEMLLIATGSQGEPRAALQRLAMDTHPDINLAAGDHVVFSAKTIPGNEEEVARLVAAFEARGIQVTQAHSSPRPIHATGHPCADELSQMYEWVRPRIAIPVHGEDRHMRSNAKIAKAAGVPVQLVGSNGNIFDLVTGKKHRQSVPVGRLWLDERDRQSVLRPVI